MSAAMLSAICWIYRDRGKDGKTFIWNTHLGALLTLGATRDSFSFNFTRQTKASFELPPPKLNRSPPFQLCTCFSMSRIVSSEFPSFAFLTCVTALERTLLTESLALLLNCLASLARFSLCSRVTLWGKEEPAVDRWCGVSKKRSPMSFLFLCTLLRCDGG